VKPRHLYVHAPFCVRRCSYCDFAVTATRVAPRDAWLDAIERELATHARACDDGRGLAWRTLYVGGGTPSLLGAGAMQLLRSRLDGWSSLERGAEWTAEANPESLTAPVAAAWREAGVNRISVGVQTFHEPALRWMGRLHGEKQARRAVRATREGGIENVSIDLIFGLPARLGRDWSDDLGRALELEPDHISLYGLTAEPATPLGRWVAQGREQLADEERYAAEYLRAVETLTAAGYHHYEVSNFALPDRESRHNLAYWDGSPYLGLGPGAHSFLPPRRFWNERDWLAYRAGVAQSGGAVAGEEIVDGEAYALELLWVGLRTARGVPRASLAAPQRERVQQWQQLGWAAAEGDRLRLTAHGWLLLDRLAIELAGSPAHAP
jgi:oxygen-independent coproporphyrinogen III oxidase